MTCVSHMTLHHGHSDPWDPQPVSYESLIAQPQDSVCPGWPETIYGIQGPDSVTATVQYWSYDQSLTRLFAA